jgi:PAS domain S-box-containing protein
MSYRVLILDDNKLDARLLSKYLEKSEEPFNTIKLVYEKEAYLHALQNFSFDLIISDYRLVNFNGLDAVRMKNRYAEDTPLIIVSGTIGEETAVELIREGAVDFLIKDKAEKRLIQVAKRAILESEERKKRKQIEKSLENTLNRYRMLFESSLDGILIGIPDDEGKIVDANKAFCDMLGYTSEEIKGIKREDFVILEKTSNDGILKEREEQGKFSGEMFFRHKNGEQIPVEITSSIVEVGDGERRSFTIVRDIRDRKEAEQKLEWGQRTQALQKDIAQIINQNIEFEEALESCLERINSFIGWNIGHIYYRKYENGDRLFESLGIWNLLDKESNQNFIEATSKIRFLLNEGLVGSVASRQESMWFNPGSKKNDYFRHKNAIKDNIGTGLMFPVVVKGHTEAVFEFYREDNIEPDERVLDTLNSVIEQIGRLIERKQYVDELQAEKNLSEQIISSLPGVFFIISEDMEMIRFNMKLEGILDYSFDEVKQMHPLEFIIEEDKQKAAQNLQEAFDTGEVETELRLKSREEKIIPFLLTGMVTKLHGQRCLLGTGIDIQERLKIEDELRKERDFIERAINSLPGLFYVLDEDNNYERVNQNFLDELGYSWDELKQMQPLEFYKEKDHARVAKAIQRAFTEGEASLVSQVKTKDGQLPWYHLTGSHFNENGRDFILGTGINITERKKLEDLLQQAHQLARIGAWEVDLVKNEVNWTSVTKQIHEVNTDYKPELETAIHFYKEGIDRDRIRRAVEEAIENGTNYDLELKIVTAKGNERWIRAIGKSEFRDGQCVRLYGSFQDIHKQKLLQEELKKSLHEKDVLLQEIHHRVKNNLALISGILQLQAYQSDIEEVKLELANSGNRIQSIATIHELLYQTENFSQINLKSEITKLIDNISETFNVETDIEYKVKLEDIILNVNQAIPCALIINEVLTNIYKHAFKEMNKGRVGVNLSSDGDQVQLEIKDNGLGLPQDFKLSEQQSLGFQLIHTLKSQIEAEITFSSDSEG